MPTNPSSSPSQQNTINGLITLAGNESTNVGNQIGLLNASIAKFQDTQNLFQTRYNYWDQYISQYELERRYLDGQYLQSPVVAQDFTDLLNQTGRLFDPNNFPPIRISEFDGSGTFSADSNNENAAISGELAKRTQLLSGFTSNVLPLNLLTNMVVTPASTTVNVSTVGGAQVVIPTGGLALIQGTTSACIVTINNVTENHILTSYNYDLDITIQTTSFSNILAGATIKGNAAGFSNPERTSKVAAVPALQFVFNTWLTQYETAVLFWKSVMDLQYNAIQGQTEEDTPDSVYTAAQAAARQTLSTYLVTNDVSDFGLTPLINLASTRPAQISSRTAYIPTRITAVSGYDNRYKYADLLYNRSDGNYTQVAKQIAQKNQLSAQQTVINAKASALSNEL